MRALLLLAAALPSVVSNIRLLVPTPWEELPPPAPHYRHLLSHERDLSEQRSDRTFENFNDRAHNYFKIRLQGVGSRDSRDRHHRGVASGDRYAASQGLGTRWIAVRPDRLLDRIESRDRNVDPQSLGNRWSALDSYDRIESSDRYAASQGLGNRWIDVDSNYRLDRTEPSDVSSQGKNWIKLDLYDLGDDLAQRNDIDAVKSSDDDEIVFFDGDRTRLQNLDSESVPDLDRRGDAKLHGHEFIIIDDDATPYKRYPGAGLVQDGAFSGIPASEFTLESVERLPSVKKDLSRSVPAELAAAGLGRAPAAEPGARRGRRHWHVLNSEHPDRNGTLLV